MAGSDEVCRCPQWRSSYAVRHFGYRSPSVSSGRDAAAPGTGLAAPSSTHACGRRSTARLAQISFPSEAEVVHPIAGPDGEELADIRRFGSDLVKRVVASITDPTYRRTYLTLPEVDAVMS